jgi:signal transduction histidine kinase/BarA-like signal transduction histidine kinase
MTNKRIPILIFHSQHNLIFKFQEMLGQVEHESSSRFAPFKIMQVGRLEEAILVMAAQEINLILLYLPEADTQNLETLKQLRTLIPKVAIVVFSDLEDEALAIEAISMGAQDYIVTKIVTPDMFRRRLLCAIARQQSRNTLQPQVLPVVSHPKFKEKRAAIEATNPVKNEFLATMSHELRTPLNAIMGLSELLQQQIFGSLNPKQMEFVNSIYSSSEHLRQLINNILELSQLEAGIEQLSLSKLEVTELCNYVLSTVAESARQKKLQLTCEITAAAEVCIADVRLIKQMLLNLLTNAIKFTSAGEVSLQVKKVKQGIAFTVADTGIGIASEQLQYLFQPFQQLDSQLNRQYEGTGLGLALTRKFAQLHGGDVIVESNLGKGSRFTLFLPQAYLEERDKEDKKNEEAKNQEWLDVATINRRILIVEDDDRSAQLLQNYLEVIGYQVERLGDGNQFLQRVRTQEPDLILLDMHLPGNVTGLDLLKSLRQEPDLQELPVLLCTPQTVSHEGEKLIQAGANDYLKKPIGITQLESMLMRYLN